MNTAISESARAVLEQLGIADSRGALTVHSPIDGSLLGSAALDTSASLSKKIELSAQAFKAWRVIPAPAGLMQLAIGDATIGEQLVANRFSRKQFDSREMQQVGFRLTQLGHKTVLWAIEHRSCFSSFALS